MSEQFYDKHIAPKLAELANQCHERGMSFLACVEYSPGEHGGSYLMTEEACLQMQMIYRCAMTAPNIDAYIIGLVRYCKENGIDTGASFVMRKMLLDAEEPTP